MYTVISPDDDEVKIFPLTYIIKLDLEPFIFNQLQHGVGRTAKSLGIVQNIGSNR